MDRFAAAANAGTAEDHEVGFRALAQAGVRSAIVSTPDVTDESAFDGFADLIGRFTG